MPKDKTLGKMWIRRDGRFSVSYDEKTFKYGIWDKTAGKFLTPDRWVSRKCAEDFLAISIALGKI